MSELQTYYETLVARGCVCDLDIPCKTHPDSSCGACEYGCHCVQHGTYSRSCDSKLCPPDPSRRKIILRYSTVDGYTTRRTFATVAGAKRWCAHQLGHGAERGTSYAISPDGIGKVEIVSGATFEELL